MTDFYQTDRWLWPFRLDGGTNTLVVEEDASGTPTTLSVDLTTSANLSNATYYAFGNTDPTGGGSPSVESIISVGDTPTLRAHPLYDEVAEKLTAASTSLTYEFTASTPANSDLTNSGLTLQHDGAVDIAYDFTASTIDPRFFGYDRDGQDASGVTQDGSSSVAAQSLDSPFSRWGMWQSPHDAHDKRRREEYDRFESSPQAPTQSRSWRWTRGRRMRDVTYQHLAGVHVWARDRADRQAEADRGGLPKGDHNNALIDLWERSQVGYDRLIVEHNEGTSDLRLYDGIEAGTIRGDFAEGFDPTETTDRQYAGERYDVKIQVAVPPASDYGSDPNSIFCH